MLRRLHPTAVAVAAVASAAAGTHPTSQMRRSISQPPLRRPQLARVRDTTTRSARLSIHNTPGVDDEPVSPSASSSFTGSSSATKRFEPPSYLYRAFMGHSTRFAAMDPPLTRADLTKLEREPLAHVTPGRVNDHVCIAMVKTLRWLADRVFRERYLHRATMLVTVAAAAPAAGSVAAYLRMFFTHRPAGGANFNKQYAHSSDRSAPLGGPSVAADVASPFLKSKGTTVASAQTATGGRHHFYVTSPVSGAPLRHSYAAELRGSLAQSESHAVHYQILSSMAEITALERGLVLALQAFHFAVYLVLFLLYPRMGFRLMAYTAEESSVVWTQMVNDVDLGKIAELRVPQLAMHYWGLERSFTAQGALVPALVSVKPHDVVFQEADNIARPDAPEKDESNAVKAPAGTLKEAVEAAKQTSDAASQSAETQSVSPSSVIEVSESEASKAKAALKERADRSPSASVKPVFTLRDVVLLIRSDEMVFRDLNHDMASELDTQPGWLRRLVDSYERR